MLISYKQLKMTDRRIPTLLYVTDPMCSWCWGFSPVIAAVRERFQERCRIQLLVGGLRPGNTERFDDQRRNMILGHWHAVHQRTGQLFDFTLRMDPDFTYDTEPATRAVVVVRNIDHALAFQYLKLVHQAFYMENQDVTKESVLNNLAISLGVEKEEFERLFQSEEIKREVWNEFDQSRELGVSGFPTLLGQHDQEITMLAHGYQPFDSLAPVIETWLNATSKSVSMKHEKRVNQETSL